MAAPSPPGAVTPGSSLRRSRGCFKPEVSSLKQVFKPSVGVAAARAAFALPGRYFGSRAGARARRPRNAGVPPALSSGRFALVRAARPRPWDARVPRAPCPCKRFRGVKSAGNPLEPIRNRGTTLFPWGKGYPGPRSSEFISTGYEHGASLFILEASRRGTLRPVQRSRCRSDAPGAGPGPGRPGRCRWRRSIRRGRGGGVSAGGTGVGGAESRVGENRRGPGSGAQRYGRSPATVTRVPVRVSGK